LLKSELVACLDSMPRSADVVASADTLCYFGALEAALRAARRALVDGGLVVFTVEAHDADADYRLNPNGRYSHRRGYVERALRDAGFADARIDPADLRLESGEPVAGWLASALAAPATEGR
jgi:predicted TPR repeat methyltransferase